MQGNIACTKKSFEKVKIEKNIFMDRVANLNLIVGFQSPYFLLNAQSKKDYVISFLLDQLKQQTSSSRWAKENPENIKIWKQSKFGIFREIKILEKRRIHITSYIRGKGSNKFEVKKAWFVNQTIENNFWKLRKNAESNEKCNNLTTILVDHDFLIWCYVNIKFRSEKTKNKNILCGTNNKWFKEIRNSIKNKEFCFKPYRKMCSTKSIKKLKFFILPSFRDQMIQEAMRVLLSIVYTKNLYELFQGFLKPSRQKALNLISLRYNKVNWFFKGSFQQHLNINESVLIYFLRKKIQDKFFINLVYKFFCVGYNKNVDSLDLMAANARQRKTLIFELFDIYMQSLDAWILNILIPKHTKSNWKKICYKHHSAIKVTTIPINEFFKNFVCNNNYYTKIFYVRYVNYFFIGVVGSKKTCERIKDEIQFFLKKNLILTFDLKNTKTIYPILNRVFFLGYSISCIFSKKVKAWSNLIGKFHRTVTKIVFTVSIKRILKQLRKKGFLNSKNKPIKNSNYVHNKLIKIVSFYKSLERKIMDYYSMAINFNRLAFKVHYILKYSCVLTIGSKMSFKTKKKTFKCFGKNLTVKTEKISISYVFIPYINFNSNFISLKNTIKPFTDSTIMDYIGFANSRLACYSNKFKNT